MRTGLLFVMLPALLLSGCMYRARVNQQLLERELRLQEDCIYRLKWELEDRQRELDEAKQRIETLEKEAGTLRDETGAEPDLSPPPSILGPSRGERGDEAPRLPPAPGGPIVEPGVETPPPTFPSQPEELNDSSSGRKSRPSPDLSGPALSQVSLTTPVANPLRNTGARSSRPTERLNPDVEIERIMLNDALTGGLNADGQSGDEMLSVVIEQRDAGDSRVLAPGDVSIVVVDPALEGREAKIARWDFESEEVAKHVRRNREGAALHFELPWPKPPQHSDLRLYVRFVTYDGRRLEANLPIEVQLAGNRGWTKSPVSLAGHDDRAAAASADANAEDGSTNRRSVYQADASGENEVETDPHREPGKRPAWSPNR